MANDLTLPAAFGKLPDAFKGAPTTNDELGAGVAASYGVVGYRGKVWMIKFGGEETKLMRDDGDGPRNSIEVVIVKASPKISKIFYSTGYQEGAASPPDCWSGDGVTPDASIAQPVNPVCATCPMNAWGSRTTDAGKPAKACADSRRMAVVPVNDIDNELVGGPMLLRCPPASLKDLKAYGDLLSTYQYPYYAAATRISFDPAEAFPKFVFQAIRPLTDEEAAKIIELREDRRVSVVLHELADPASTAEAAVPMKEVKASPFEQDLPPESKPAAKANGSAAPKAAAPKAAPKATPKVVVNNDAPKTEAAPKATPAPAQSAKQSEAAKKLAAARAKAAAAAAEAELAAAEAEAEDTTEDDDTTVVEEGGGEAPTGFDDMLEKLL